MYNDQTVIAATLALNAQEFLNQVGALRGQMDGAFNGGSSGANNYSNGLTRLGNQMNNVGQTMESVLAPIDRFGRDGIRIAAENKNAMNFTLAKANINVKTEDGKDMAQALDDKVREVASKSQFDYSTIMGGAEEMFGAGFNLDQIINSLDTVNKYSVMAGVSIEQGANTMGNAMTVYGIAAEDASRIAGVLATADNEGATNQKQLSDAMNNTAGNAARFGVSIEEVAGSISSMSNAGLKGGKAGTALNSTLRDLYTPSAKAAKSFAEIGLEAYDAQGKTREFVDVLKDLKEKTKDMTDQERDDFFNTNFTDTGAKGMNTLLSDKNFDLIANLKVQDNEGVLDEKYGIIRNDNTQATLSSIEENKAAIKASFFENANDWLVVVNDILSKINGWLQKLSPEIRNVLGILMVVGVPIAKMIGTFGRMLGTIGMIKAGFGGAATAATATGTAGAAAGVATSTAWLPVLGVILAIIAVIVIIGLLIYKFVTDLEGFKEGLKNVVEGFKVLFQGIIEIIVNLVQAVVDGIVSIVDIVTMALAQMVVYVIELIMGIITSLINMVLQGIELLLNGILQSLDLVIGFIEGFITRVIESFLRMTQLLLDAFVEFGGQLIEALTVLLDMILAFIVESAEKIKATIIEVAEIFGIFEGPIGLVIGFVEGLGDAIANMVIGALGFLNDLKNGFLEIIGLKGSAESGSSGGGKPSRSSQSSPKTVQDSPMRSARAFRTFNSPSPIMNFAQENTTSIMRNVNLSANYVQQKQNNPNNVSSNPVKTVTNENKSVELKINNVFSLNGKDMKLFSKEISKTNDEYSYRKGEY